MDRLWFQEHPLIKSAELRRFVYRANVLVIEIISAINYVDLNCSEQPGAFELKGCWRRFLQAIRSSRPTWQRCLSLIVPMDMCVVVRMLIIQSHQYSYDFERFRLEQLRMSQESNSTMAKHLEIRVEQQRDILKGYGAPHREWNMMVEFLHVYMIAVNTLNLVIAPIYLALTGGLDFPWLQFCMNQKSEVELQAKSIADQVEGYINSRRLYIQSHPSSPIRVDPTQIELSRLCELPTRGRSDSSIQTETSGEYGRGSPRYGSTMQAFKYQAGLNRISRIQTGGRLKMFLDRPAGWLDCLVMMNLFFVASVVVYSCLATGLCHTYIKHIYDGHQRHVQIDSYKDIVALVLFCYVLACVILSSACNFSLSFCTLLDLHRLVYSLKLNILRTIYRNAHRLEQIMALPKSAVQLVSIVITARNVKSTDNRRENLREICRLIDEIETETMASILCYRCFCAYYQRSKRSLEINSALVFAYAGLSPLLARLHVPYLNDHDSRVLVMIAGLAASIPCLLFSWPNCLIHSRCIKLHNILTKLLAQLIDVKLDESMQNYFNLDHEITLLRKELERPDETSHRFAIKLFGVMDFTFSNLIRVQFWIILLVMSLISNLDSMGERLHILSDPFGVLE